eukprot:GHVP01063423.1.p1 GENE.GHVP01063423.1~~GHVP01063423.1.p1  ORF type:complete len:179 (-),score=30.13 GHVP01063423.1:35-571(-)
MDFELLKLPLDQLNSAVIVPNVRIPGEENEAAERSLSTAELTFHGPSHKSLATYEKYTLSCNYGYLIKEVEKLFKSIPKGPSSLDGTSYMFTAEKNTSGYTFSYKKSEESRGYNKFRDKTRTFKTKGDEGSAKLFKKIQKLGGQCNLRFEEHFAQSRRMNSTRDFVKDDSSTEENMHF